MVAFGRLLHLVVHPHQPPINQGSNYVFSDLCWICPLQNTGGQLNARFKTKCVAIHTLRGGNICISEYQGFQIRHCGLHRFLSGMTNCSLFAQISYPLLIMTHPNIYPPLSCHVIPRSHIKTTDHHKPGMGCFLIIIASGWILPRRYWNCLLPPFPPRHLVLRQRSLFPATTATPYTCATASFIIFLFSTQNNEVKGESIRIGETIHPRVCVVASIQRRVAQLQLHSASTRTPLVSVSRN